MTQQDSESIAPAGEVFISYSWDSEAHLRGVLELSNRLRSEGIDCVIDQYEVSPPDGWPRWMDKKIRDSRLILMICTETYCKRVMGEESPDKGMGVRWEGGLIYQHLYNAGANQKFIPVLFRAADKKFIPTPLQSAMHYELDSEAGYDRLYARLLNRPGVRKPELGRVRPAPNKEVKTNLSMYVTGPINVDLWNQAKWRGTLFLQYDGQPPILGLGFLDERYISIRFEGKRWVASVPTCKSDRLFFYADLANSRSLAITTVVQELLSLGKSRFAAMRISSRGCSPRMIGQ